MCYDVIINAKGFIGMKTVAIIAEYNPFHNGHLYQINKIKQETKADCLVVVMSGNFVQRGTPAIVDKYTRTKLALSNGVDIVLELPVYYATASAELFAYGAVSMLNKLGIVDYLCFGSECGDIHLLGMVAQVLIDEPLEYKQHLKQYLKEGYSYPMARKQALTDYMGESHALEQVINQPNNILGIEYIKALKKLNSNIMPVTLLREGSGYHEKRLTHTFCSATALRSYYEDSSNWNESLSIGDFVPVTTKQMLEESFEKLFPIKADDFSSLLYYRLQLETKESLLNFLDVTEELSNRILNEVNYYTQFLDFTEQIKTKQYTFTRIERVLLHILLGITKENMDSFLSNPESCYGRVLGFKKSASVHLKRMQKNGTLPLITKVADARKILSPLAMICFDADIKATHLYNQVVFTKFHTIIKDEYKSGPVRYDFGIE